MKEITCQICNTTLGVKGISIHLQKLHNTQFRDYLKSHMADFLQYGWKWCDNCGKEPARNFGNKKWATCSRECSATIRSQQTKGHTAWNKGILHTDATKKKLSIARKRVLSENRGYKCHSPEIKQRLSILAKERAQQPDYVNPMQGKTHTPESIAKIGKRVGSKLELLAMKLLDESGYMWYTHQFFITKDGKSHSYDFKLTGLPIVIEVDGDYWHGGPGVKKHFFDVERIKKVDIEKERIANERGYKLIRVWESELKHAPQILVERIKNVHNILLLANLAEPGILERISESHHI